jgi:hypothetical protein
MTDNKFAKRKKRRKKLNILANLVDVGKHFVNNTNIYETLFKENLFPLIQLHLLMHNNNNYFESIHNKKFLFYSQLIERYRSILSINEPTYLFLTSSILKTPKEIFKIHILKSNLQNILVSDKKGNFNIKKKHDLSNSTTNINQITATDELIDGNDFKHSNQEAQPFRSELRTSSMSNNLQGETIPMAYSSSFLDIRNNNEHQVKISKADNSSSNYLDLENNLKFEEREINQFR